MENEKNLEAQKERVKIAKRLALTCRSDDLDAVIEKDKEAKNSTSRNEIDDADEDDFFQQYLKKKIEEMNKKYLNL